MPNTEAVNQQELLGALGCVIRNGVTLCAMMMRGSLPNQEVDEEDEHGVIENDPLDVMVDPSEIKDVLRFGTLGSALKVFVTGKQTRTEYDMLALFDGATRSIENETIGFDNKKDFHLTIIDDEHPVKANQVITDDVVVILDTDVKVKKISADVIFMIGGNLQADIIESAKHILINAESVDVRKLRAANGIISVDDINFRSFEYTNCQVFCGVPIEINGVPHTPIHINSERAFDLKQANASLREFLDVLMKAVEKDDKMDPLSKRIRKLSIQPFGLVKEAYFKKAEAAPHQEQTAAPDENVETNKEGMARPEVPTDVLRFGQAFLTDEEWNVVENLSNSHLKNVLGSLNSFNFVLGATKKELIAQLRTVEKILPNGSIDIRKFLESLKKGDAAPEDDKGTSDE